MTAKKWCIGFFIEFFILLTGVLLIAIFVDPYFHYHKPVSHMFYSLNNERSQNDGIIKQFDYDTIITGTSMAQNFRTSEFNEVFGADAIKVCFSGGSYKEINDNIKKAFESGHDVKYVLRCLDYNRIISDKDKMRFDLGEYPIYLYDQNPFNDVNYILNKEIIYNICLPMLTDSYLEGKDGGITSFDEYNNWSDDEVFGAESVLGERKEFVKAKEENTFTEEDYKTVKENIKQNVTDLAEEHPETTFYYFFSPYSIAYWGGLYESGDLNRQLKAETIAIEEMLKYSNIKLYSFNNQWDITTNLDNYTDANHYGEWINTEIIHMIHNGIGQLTEENYRQYIANEHKFYSEYNYHFYDGSVK